MAKPELGVKRQCESCTGKFFDLNKDPITCPRCGTIFQVTVTATVAARPAPAPENDKEEDDVVEAGPETVSLEEADEDNDDGKVAAEVPDDVGVDVDIDDDDDDDNNTDDTFLADDDDDNDDVSGLIDSDIKKEDES